jgi:hypothetical protein
VDWKTWGQRFLGAVAVCTAAVGTDVAGGAETGTAIHTTDRQTEVQLAAAQVSMAYNAAESMVAGPFGPGCTASGRSWSCVLSICCQP